MNIVFQNYEANKIIISSPDLLNQIILFLFFILSVLTLKNEKTSSSNLLPINQTLQLKGVAIFSVILGHLWVHVSKNKAMLVFSGDAVSMFLILSGYGLAVSNNFKKLNLKEFFLKRVCRVLIPYWMVTIINNCVGLYNLGKDISK